MMRVKRVLVSLYTAFICLLYLKVSNFHAVKKGVLYRSAQLNAKKLADYVKRHNIKSIVNLRGMQSGRHWYQNEKRLSDKLGLKHIDFDLSAVRKTPVIELDRIVAAMRDAPKPILIHCYAGADRTGLISAIWKFSVEKETPQKALKELSWLKGHFRHLHIKTWAMERSFWDYVEHIRKKKDQFTEMAFPGRFDNKGILPHNCGNKPA